jgi:pimeloyl-ACP methyl ester carboxylesterase
MKAHRRRPTTAGRAVRLAAAVALGVLLGLGIDVARAGGPLAWLAHWGVLPPYEARGILVPVDAAGRSVYLDCRGTGSPTVVFEAGLGDGAGGWGFVFPETGGFTRACAWDRPGIARSAARGRHTALDTARDLRAALAAAGEQGPFVIVGHSLGGVYARIFAAAYRDEIAGVVLVEPFTPDISPAERAGVQLEPSLAAEWAAGLEGTRELIERLEDLDWPATADQLAAARLGDVPLELIFVDQRLRYDERIDPVTKARLIAAWRDLVLAWSTDARLTIADGSRHIVQLDRPDLVVDSIRRLVDRARAVDPRPGEDAPPAPSPSSPPGSGR